MSGRTYVWSKYHNKTSFSENLRTRLQDEYVQFSAAVGLSAIVILCLLEVIFHYSL